MEPKKIDQADAELAVPDSYNAATVVKNLGGVTKAAHYFSIKPPSISAWIKKNHIPKARLQALVAARPSVFNDGSC